MSKPREMIDVVGTGFTVLDRLYSDGLFASEALGGSCGNVLVSLAMLHRQVVPVLSLGFDEIGSRLVDEFRVAGANTQYICRHYGRLSPVLRQELDTSSGRHSFSFVCDETLEEYPRYEPIDRDQVRLAMDALERCTVFYADRLTPTILEAMECAHSSGAIIYFEPSIYDESLFSEALALTSILKYSSDRLGQMLDESVAASTAIAIVTHGEDGLEVRQGHERVWSAAIPAKRVLDTCGSGDMVSVGLIDWLLTQSISAHTSLTLDDIMSGVCAGQRLAAENCAFAGARGVFQHHDIEYLRTLLSEVGSHF